MLASAVMPATAQIMLLTMSALRRGKAVSRVFDALVEDVQLLGGCVLLQQLRRHLALCRKDDAVFGQNANGGSGVGDGFQGILDLVEATLRGEDGCLERTSVAARACICVEA